MVTNFRSKIFFLSVLVCAPLFPIQTTYASSNVSTVHQKITDLNLIVTIENLTVQLDTPSSMSFNFLFNIFNPNNYNVTLMQDFSCGFGILAPVISNYEELTFSSIVPGWCKLNVNDPFSITYKPGYTEQYYASTSSYHGYTGKDFPVGFYFFDIYLDRDVNIVTPFDAVYMYFGNDNSRIMYQTAKNMPPFSWGPPYGTSSLVPVSDQLAQFEDATSTTSSVSSVNQYNLNFIIPVVIIFLPVALVITYVLSKKRNYTKSNTLTTNNNNAETTTSSQTLSKTLTVCSSCHAQVLHEDVFCSNCGKKIEYP